MNRLLSALFAACLSVGAVAQSPRAAEPDIQFGTYQYNVGKFSKAKTPRRGAAFKFTNTGSAPLVIENVDPMCGCISVKWPRQPIPPGGSDYITVIYEGHTQLPHYFRKMVFVNSNCVAHKHVRLFLEGEMTE